MLFEAAQLILRIVWQLINLAEHFRDLHSCMTSKSFIVAKYRLLYVIVGEGNVDSSKPLRKVMTPFLPATFYYIF